MLKMIEDEIKHYATFTVSVLEKSIASQERCVRTWNKRINSGSGTKETYLRLIAEAELKISNYKQALELKIGN